MKRLFLYLSPVLIFLSACRPQPVNPPTPPDPSPDTLKRDALGLTGRNGFYLLCEGNMGSNKATIDYFDYTNDTLYRNIYPRMNPTAVQALGDVGNDIAVYGHKVYATINCSGLLEVMNSAGEHMTKIDIPNCREILCHAGYVYVSSYAGPIDTDNPDYDQRGYVAKIDTSTLTIVDTCEVGFQPDGMAVAGEYLYVANSGGYMAPRYDSTLSVIRLSDMKEVRRISVAINLNKVVADARGILWVTSRGDYEDTPEMLYRVNPMTDEVRAMGFGASVLAQQGDSIYFFSTEYSNITHKYVKAFGVLNTLTAERVADMFITDGTESKIVLPYALYVDAGTRDIYVTDARDYVTPGVLYRYSRDGKLLGSWRTGDIPGHFARIQ